MSVGTRQIAVGGCKTTVGARQIAVVSRLRRTRGCKTTVGDRQTAVGSRLRRIVREWLKGKCDNSGTILLFFFYLRY